MEIIFVRHGESFQNISNLAESDDDDKLTDNGMRQAEITGKYLNKIYGKFDIIYSSPKNRCISTANIIKKETN